MTTDGAARRRSHAQVLDSHAHFWDLRNRWHPALEQMAHVVGPDRLCADFGVDDY